MFDEEENNTDFSAENFLGAILRKEREMSRIFGNRRAKEDITKNESSTSTKDKEVLKDDLKRQERTFEYEETMKDTTKNGASISTKDKKPLKNDIEEQEKNTTYSWPPTSSKGRYTYKTKSQKRYNKSDSSITSYFEERMKNFYKKSSTTKIEVNKEITNDLTNATELDEEKKTSEINNEPKSIILSKYSERILIDDERKTSEIINEQKGSILSKYSEEISNQSANNVETITKDTIEMISLVRKLLRIPLRWSVKLKHLKSSLKKRLK